MRNLLAAVSAVVLAGAFAPAHAATVLDVSWNDGCGKTSCFNGDGVFTQTWSARGASGPMTVGQFLMSRGVLGDLDSSTFRISFQVNGQEVGTWGSYNMGAIGGDELSFDGLDFDWNPEDGDLTLVLEIVKPGKGAGGGGFTYLRAPSEAPPPQDEGFEFEAIVPGLDEQDLSAVPEPGAWALMIAGFAMAGALLRQRRRVLAPVRAAR